MQQNIRELYAIFMANYTVGDMEDQSLKVLYQYLNSNRYKTEATPSDYIQHLIDKYIINLNLNHNGKPTNF